MNYLKESAVILALDAELGLLELTVTDEGVGQVEHKVVVSHKMCESFDTIERAHIVLLCQNQGHSTILEVYR